MIRTCNHTDVIEGCHVCWLYDNDERYGRLWGNPKFMRTLKWSYGVTTVPARFSTYLPRTLNSLKAAGFDNPRLFIDGYMPLTPETAGMACTQHDTPLQVVGNWILALWELYIREPSADRYAVFQDDFITYKNLRSYLNQSPYPPKGYLNLYSFPSNESFAPRNHRGWFESRPCNPDSEWQTGRGAVALVFNRDAVIKLLSAESLVMKPSSATRSTISIDGAIVTAMNMQGYREFCHMPSLVQHIGDKSSMGNNPHAKSDSFLGEDYDALQLLQTSVVMNNSASVSRVIGTTPITGLGDVVEKTLESMGITKDRVSSWLGGDCGCRERKEKLNQLSTLVQQSISGKLKNAKRFFEELIS